MHKEERKNADGQVISIRFFCGGKDHISGKPKLYTKTWKLPQGLSAKEIKKEALKAELDFADEVEKKSNGTIVKENYIKFSDFANEWLENILARNEHSYTYYNSSKHHLKIIIPYFKDYLLKNIGPNIIQKFYDYISSATYEKQVVVVKQSIGELIKELNLRKEKTADDIGISRHTLRLACQIGQRVDISTAKTICSYFNVPIDRYFDITTSVQRYSKATIKGTKTTLVMILQEATRRQLIEHNYATKTYTTFKADDIKQKEVYSEEEAKLFIKLALEEPDLRKRSILMILIGLGLRKGEIVALNWNNIDFNKNTLAVNENAVYVSDFGVKLKSPKTKKSKRIISMPKMVADVLLEYKDWWDNQKLLHGDLWASTNYLYLQDNGQIINPCTVNDWVTKFESKHGLKHIPCHSLRHQCTCLMISSGVPIKVASQILGHSSVAFTLEVYNHIMQGQEQEASEIYNDFLCSVN